ncbi:MAG: sulfatase-like hydrolase/transferase [Polyangiaceae bacterium]|nr:sulfatase-like hydrolase/transferase [Polyangiaceae bacterium]
MGTTDLLAVLAALVLFALLVALAHAQLSRLGPSTQVEHRARGAAGVLLVAGLLGGVLRDRLWDEHHPEAARLARALPWAANLERASNRGGDATFGIAVDRQVAAELGTVRQAMSSATLSAAERPNLLVVHVESLRADVFTSGIMPNLTRIAEQCRVPARHYTTGNNTGTAVFGINTGLNAYQYPIARDRRAPAVPLLVLKRLGYRTFTHFANNLKTYDDVFGVVFGDVIDEAFVPPDDEPHVMDRAVVAHYLESLAKGGLEPRFDYLVLDSTHYPYGYPKEFERHTPSGTLELGLMDAVPTGPDAMSNARARIPLVKNRYLNAVGWVDTQLRALVDGLQRTGQLAKTWFVVLGDHGESFWERDTLGHGTSLDEQQIRVVALFCGLGTGGLAVEQSSHADVFPTWFARMRLAGTPGHFMMGRSVLGSQDANTVVVGMGVTGQFRSRRFVAVGHGLKVQFDNDGRLTIAAATSLEDEPLVPVPEAAGRVLLEALGTKLLRSGR